jgi:hypothetical protein
MNMPILSPLPIETKGEPFPKRIRVWLTRRAWRVVEDWEHDLPDGRRVVIPKDFISDGASIPRLLSWLLSPTGLLFIPGLIHDFGYRFDYIWIRDENGKLCQDKRNSGQKYWDKLFYEVGVQVNGMKAINFLARMALGAFGFLAWNSNREKAENGIMPYTFAEAAVGYTF